HAVNRLACRAVREIRAPELGGLALSIRDAHPRDVLLEIIRCDVLDLVREAHVPVDAAWRAVSGVGTADLEEKSDGKGGVGFLHEEMIVGAFEVAHIPLGPVALLA